LFCPFVCPLSQVRQFSHGGLFRLFLLLISPNFTVIVFDRDHTTLNPEGKAMNEWLLQSRSAPFSSYVTLRRLVEGNSTGELTVDNPTDQATTIRALFPKKNFGAPNV
jgi:hypothetical protein